MTEVTGARDMEKVKQHVKTFLAKLQSIEGEARATTEVVGFLGS